MAELEKRLAELEIAVGSGSDKQVHTDSHTLLTNTNLYIRFSFTFTPLNFMLLLLCVTIHKLKQKSWMGVDSLLNAFPFFVCVYNVGTSQCWCTRSQFDGRKFTFLCNTLCGFVFVFLMCSQRTGSNFKDDISPSKFVYRCCASSRSRNT